MKIKCTQENLARGLAIVNKAVTIKVTLPILGNILVSAKDGVLTLASSNLETSIVAKLNASVEEEGSVAVPAKLFSEYISSLPAGNLTLTTLKAAFKVDSGDSTAKFNCMSAEDFPSIPSVKKGVHIDLNAREFSSAVLSTAFCSALSDSKPSLTGVLLKKSGGTLVVVATDGFRLSEKIIDIGDNSKKDDFTLLVPAKALSEVARMLVSSEDDIKLTYSETENLTIFEHSAFLIAIRILDGEFPDYKRIIPASHVLSAHSAAAELIQAVKIANVFAKEAKEGNNLLRLAFDPVGECVVSSSSTQSGEGSTKFKLNVEAQERLTLAFNSKYLLDFFNNVKSDEVDIFSSGESSPCVFKTKDTSGFIHLIMPVKLTSS